MQRSMKTRTLRTVKAALSCFMSASLALYMPVMAYANDPWDISNGDVSVHRTSETEQNVSQGTRSENDTNPTITGTSSEHHVTIEADQGTTATVTFENLNINTRETSDNEQSRGEAAVSVSSDGNVNIEINGSNSLTAGLNHAGLEDHLNGTLTIKDDNNNGNLSATGGWGGAGIGGGYQGAGSNITISGGTVTALGGADGAGIGGGLVGTGSNITISGGAVTATGGDGGAGIGAGAGNTGSNITISGGTVTATGGDMGAGIGGGSGGHGNYITISGGTVTAIGGNGSCGAGIGGGSGNTGSNIIISGSAVVYAAGGYDSNLIYGAAIGNGSWGGEADIDTTGLYTTGSITKYAAGATLDEITGGTAIQSGDSIVGTVEPPVDPDPVNPNPINAYPANPNQAVPTFKTATIVQTAENSTRTDEATSTAPATEQDTDAAFNAAVDIQIDDLLRQLYSLLEAGRLDEANALIAKGFVINAGTHKGFDRVTLEKLGELSRAGVAVTINFTYAGVNYSVTIPAKSEIDPASLIDESGYCGFPNLM